VLLMLLLTAGGVSYGAPAGEGVEVSAALGAVWDPWVGEEAALTALDPVATEGVRVVQSALAVEAHGPVGSHALLRVEEGIFHAGALEAAEAQVGWLAPGGFGEASVGRADIPGTADRDWEPEAQIFAVRPLLSRVLLPNHAAGVGATVAYPDRASLRAGLSYLTATADAPFRWARLRVHPLGPPPEREDAAVDGLALTASAGWLGLDSEAQGELRLLDADLDLRWRFVALGGEGVWVKASSAPPRQEWILRAQSLLCPLPKGSDLHLALRGERVTGVVEGEDARWLLSARLAFRSADARFVPFVEAALSREAGTGVAAGEDVVALSRGLERVNDRLSLGARYRF
jgi:hypothetical protein